MKRFMLGLAVAAALSLPPAAFAEEASNGVSTLHDTWLTSKTKLKFMMDRRVSAREISVETQDSVITLRGKVGSVHQRQAAEQIARETSGAKSVTSALQVVPEAQRKAVDARDGDLLKAVKARLAKDDILFEDIAVRADASVITLMGIVADGRARTRAADLARGVPGVKSVRNELRPRETQSATAAPR
jgi:osmotically-inducible protein OsmY